MGIHSENMAIAADIHAAVFAGEISYTPPGGSAGGVDAILYQTRIERRDSSIGVIEVAVRDLIVQQSELASPVINGVFTIDSEAWTIERMRKTTSNRWMLSLVKVDAAELNRDQYRRGAR
jgi:hypothetical protein